MFCEINERKLITLMKLSVRTPNNGTLSTFRTKWCGSSLDLTFHNSSFPQTKHCISIFLKKNNAVKSCRCTHEWYCWTNFNFLPKNRNFSGVKSFFLFCFWTMLLVSVLIFNMLYLFLRNILEVLGAGHWIRGKMELRFATGAVHFPRS